jgi:hypothetical protein
MCARGEPKDALAVEEPRIFRVSGGSLTGSCFGITGNAAGGTGSASCSKSSPYSELGFVIESPTASNLSSLYEWMDGAVALATIGVASTGNGRLGSTGDTGTTGDGSKAGAITTEASRTGVISVKTDDRLGC